MKVLKKINYYNEIRRKFSKKYEENIKEIKKKIKEKKKISPEIAGINCQYLNNETYNEFKKSDFN